jgi:hypothetical protein
MRKWGGGEKGGGDIWVRVGASQKSCGRMTQQAKRVSFAVVFNFIHTTSYSCVRDSIAYGMVWTMELFKPGLRGLSIVLFIRSNFPTGTTGHVPRWKIKGCPFVLLLLGNYLFCRLSFFYNDFCWLYMRRFNCQLYVDIRPVFLFFSLFLKKGMQLKYYLKNHYFKMLGLFLAIFFCIS